MPAPNFENYTYAIAVKPTTTKVPNVWSQLEEVERRIVRFEWVVSQITTENQHERIEFTDAGSIIFVTFEMAVQYLKDAYESTRARNTFYNNVLNSHPRNTLEVKGIRTLRHLDAHKGPVPMLRHIRWQLATDAKTFKIGLPAITLAEHQSLTSKPLPQAQLPDWETLCGKSRASEIFRNALSDLAQFVSAVEPIL